MFNDFKYFFKTKLQIFRKKQTFDALKAKLKTDQVEIINIKM